MIDDKIEEIITKLTDINDTIKNYICAQCNKRGIYGDCWCCYNCNEFEPKGGNDDKI